MSFFCFGDDKNGAWNEVEEEEGRHEKGGVGGWFVCFFYRKKINGWFYAIMYNMREPCNDRISMRMTYHTTIEYNYKTSKCNDKI